MSTEHLVGLRVHGDVEVWDENAQEWRSLAGGGAVAELGDIGDVEVDDPQVGEALVYGEEGWTSEMIDTTQNLDGGRSDTNYVGLMSIDAGSSD